MSESRSASARHFPHYKLSSAAGDGSCMAADTANSAGYRPPIQPTQKKDLQLEY